MCVHQIALSVGATVIGTVSSEAKAKFVRDSGVQHVVVTSSQSTVDEVLRITNGKGVQAVFDGVGKGERPTLPLDAGLTSRFQIHSRTTSSLLLEREQLLRWAARVVGHLLLEVS